MYKNKDINNKIYKVGSGNPGEALSGEDISDNILDKIFRTYIPVISNEDINLFNKELYDLVNNFFTELNGHSSIDVDPIEQLNNYKRSLNNPEDNKEEKKLAKKIIKQIELIIKQIEIDNAPSVDISQPMTQPPGTRIRSTFQPMTQAPGTRIRSTSQPMTQAPETSKRSTSQPMTQAPETSKRSTSQPMTQAPGTRIRSTYKLMKQDPDTLKSNVFKPSVKTSLKYREEPDEIPVTETIPGIDIKYNTSVSATNMDDNKETIIPIILGVGILMFFGF